MPLSSISDSNGTQQRTIALWIKDIIDIDAGNIINGKTFKKTQSNYDKLIIQLNGIFKANTFLAKQMKRISKSKKK